MSDSNLLNVMPLPMQAGGAITINRFVKQDTAAARQVLRAAAASDVILGAAIEAQATTGAPVGIQVFGVAKVEAGGVVAIGDQVTTDASGRAVTAATGNNTAGKALTAAGAAGDIIEVLLNPINTNGPTTP